MSFRMEGCGSENNNMGGTKKRARDDDSPELGSGLNLPELKRFNAGTDHGGYQAEPERVDQEDEEKDLRCDSPVSEVCQLDSEDASYETNGAEDGEELVSQEVVKFREDILDILDETETVLADASQDLDSVIRSFEEEILQLSPLTHRPDVELTSQNPLESQPDLGYLLEASDDELGLPPTVPVAGDQTQNNLPMNLTVGNEGVVDGLDVVAFEDELPSYDSYEFGLEDGVTEGENYVANSNGDFVTVGGLFDYADGSDFTDMTFRPESLPAL